ncbi:MAG: PD-(D/E)XK nuclease family protein, partial [Oscillospiraceae bacterium]
KIIKAPTAIEKMEIEKAEETIFEPNMELYEKICTINNKKYIFENETKLATKISVSKLIKTQEEKLFSKEPMFASRDKATSAQKGLAFHSFMLYANHENAAKNIEEEKSRLIIQEFMTREDVALLNNDDIFELYNSELFSRMKKSSFLKREMRFMAQLSGKELEGLLDIGDNEEIVVQGISDIVFEEGEKLIIADYKTDNVKTADELVERYKNQLDIYEKILSKVTQKSEFEKIIYSVKLRKEIVIL